MGTVIVETDIQREDGKLYYVATNEDGCLTICETALSRKGRKRKEEQSK